MLHMEDLKDAKFGDGTELPPLHTDHDIDMEVKFGCVCQMLDQARAALERVLTMNVVTPAAVSMKNEVRRVLDNTTPAVLYEE